MLYINFDMEVLKVKKSKLERISFINDFVEEIKEQKAAIFAGAGLSIPTGNLNWKDLLREDAKAIGINVDEEHDLLAVAQYIYNESGTRNKITKLVKKYINRNGTLTKNHDLLATLPIATFWTTNYDGYIEESFKKNNKTIDIKKNVMDLSTEVKSVDATLYKMHGDIEIANEVVLIKDDYEIYDKKNELFTIALKGDLINKTFLFIGFSFDDPNLSNILSRVRMMLEGNPRQHFCVFKKVSKEDFKFIECKKARKKRFAYEKNKQSLRINDLKRYGIKAILVDSYEELTDILEEINFKVKKNNVFISSSFEERELDQYTIDDVSPERFIFDLANQLHKRGFKITSGYGKGAGSIVINGVLDGSEQTNKSLDESLSLYPFPFPKKEIDDVTRKKIHEKYRNKMLDDCGVSIFLLGNKYDEAKNLINADGVRSEFELSYLKGLKVIPIIQTGYMSKELGEELEKDFEKFYGDNMKLLKKFKELNKAKNSEEIISKIIEIIDKL